MAETVRDATIALLRALDATTLFGNPGSTELGLLAPWPDDFRYILALQESCVVAMADGHAQATGRAAIVNLHSAAGVGHALGSIHTAWRNQAPLVITAGQQARALLPHRPFLGAIDAAAFPKPYVKWAVEPATAQDVPQAIAQAFRLALRHPRGPTFVSIPSDDWSRPAGPAIPMPDLTDVAMKPDPSGLAQLIAAVGTSRRPALVLGPAVDRDGTADLAVTVAERLNAAVWAAPIASRASFPEDHPLFAGFLPAAPGPLARTLQPHDVVVVFGPAFTLHVPGDLGALRVLAPLFQVTDDIEAAAAAICGTPLIAGTAPVLAALLKAPAAMRPAPPARTKPARIAAADPIPAALALQAIADRRRPGSIVVEEAPSHKDLVQRHLPMQPGGFFAMASGGLGFALPAAIGIGLARPCRPVIAIVGDGSAMYAIQALWTAAQHGVDLIVVVLNNGGYGAMRAFSRLNGAALPPGIDLPGLDFPALARGQGCPALRIDRSADLDAGLDEAFAMCGPRLVEIVVDQTVPALYGLD